MNTVANLAMDLTNTACAHAGPVAVRVDNAAMIDRIPHEAVLRFRHITHLPGGTQL